jgi:YebC/PmpR family DNA-binding regulatory protein
MGAQWKHAGRVTNASKRSAVIGKLVKEVIVAAKVGGSNPEGNPRLRAAIEAAKKGSVPRDTLDRAIKKGAGLLEPVQYDQLFFEGFAPHQVPVIVECLTDNKNRTASDVRLLFRKGQLGAQGSVAWMFDRVGVVEASYPELGRDLEEAAIEASAQRFEPLEKEEVPEGHTGGRFITEPSDLDVCAKMLTTLGWVLTQSELSYLAKSRVELGESAKKEVLEFLEALDDNDDVHRIYTAI